MAEPKIADRKPAVVDLEPGTYHWCACGQSKNQPYCDGSHAGTEFSPVEFKIEDKKKVAFCMCKHTAKAPLCDGTHRTLG